MELVDRQTQHNRSTKYRAEQSTDMESKWKFVIFVKFLLQAGLLFVFLKFFGLVSWRRFFEEDVYVSSSQEYSSNIKPPGVTICPGLRSGHTDLLNDSCASKNGTHDIVSCVEAYSFDLRSTVLNMEGGYHDQNEQKTLNETEWTSDFFIGTILKIMQILTSAF